MQETSSLCKIFLGDEQFQNHEKTLKIELSNTLNSEPNNLNHQLVVSDGSTSNNMANGSTSKSEVVVIIPPVLRYMLTTILLFLKVDTRLDLYIHLVLSFLPVFTVTGNRSLPSIPYFLLYLVQSCKWCLYFQLMTNNIL